MKIDMKFICVVKINEDYYMLKAKIGMSSRCLPVSESWWLMRTSAKAYCELPPGAVSVND
jgi:hypothetical protein